MISITQNERGVPIVIDYDMPTQLAKIAETLTRIPTVHLSAIRRIQVDTRLPSGGAHFSDRLSLSVDCFEASYNRRNFLTLLHEIGHAVDMRDNIVSQFAQRCSASAASGLSSTGDARWITYRSIYSGSRNRCPGDRTQPAIIENFADGYSRYIGRRFGSDPRNTLNADQRALISELARM